MNRSFVKIKVKIKTKNKINSSKTNKILITNGDT